MRCNADKVLPLLSQEQPQYNLFERTKVEGDYVPLVSVPCRKLACWDGLLLLFALCSQKP